IDFRGLANSRGNLIERRNRPRDPNQIALLFENPQKASQILKHTVTRPSRSSSSDSNPLFQFTVRRVGADEVNRITQRARGIYGAILQPAPPRLPGLTAGI